MSIEQKANEITPSEIICELDKDIAFIKHTLGFLEISDEVRAGYERKIDMYTSARDYIQSREAERNTVSVPQNTSTEVKSLYKGFMLNNEIGVCLEGTFAGWLVAKHPDGQWVSLAKLPTNNVSISIEKPSEAERATCKQAAPSLGANDHCAMVQHGNAPSLSDQTKMVATEGMAEWTGKCRFCESRYSTRWELEDHEKSHRTTEGMKSVDEWIEELPVEYRADPLLGSFFNAIQANAIKAACVLPSCVVAARFVIEKDGKQEVAYWPDEDGKQTPAQVLADAVKGRG